MSKIVILGAGVIGLTTAMVLQQHGYKVKIIAKNFPSDHVYDPKTYTSPFAAAYWRGSTNISNLQQEREKKTLFYFWNLLNKKEYLDIGLMYARFNEYWENDEDFTEPWLKKKIFDTKEARDSGMIYCQIQQSELPDNVACGIAYSTITINPVSYLRYLEETIINHGGFFVKRTVDDIFDVIDDKTEVVINCLGLEARRVVSYIEKDKIYPIKGQLVIAELPRLNTCFYLHYHDKPKYPTYVVPRSDGTVALGGTRWKNHWSTEIDDRVTEEIITNCQKLIPMLKKEHVIETTVGLRPARNEGIHLASEYLVSEKNKRKIFLVSNYGHGGTGYQTSYACALEVLEMIRNNIDFKH